MNEIEKLDKIFYGFSKKEYWRNDFINYLKKREDIFNVKDEKTYISFDVYPEKYKFKGDIEKIIIAKPCASVVISWNKSLNKPLHELDKRVKEKIYIIFNN